MEETREQLIEWVEKNWAIIPDHIRVMRTFAKPIHEQETHILRTIKKHFTEKYV